MSVAGATKLLFFIFEVDLVEKYGKLQFNLDYYTEVLDLDYILDCFPEDNFTKKYRALNEAMIGLITDYRYIFHTNIILYSYVFFTWTAVVLCFQSTDTCILVLSCYNACPLLCIKR